MAHPLGTCRNTHWGSSHCATLVSALKVAATSDFLGYLIGQVDLDGLDDRVGLLKALETNYATTGAQSDLDAVATTLTRLERSLMQYFRVLTTLGYCPTTTIRLTRLSQTDYAPFAPPCVCEGRNTLRRRLSNDEGEAPPSGATGGHPVAAGFPAAAPPPSYPLAGSVAAVIQADIDREEELELEEEELEEDLELEIKTEP